MVGLHGKPYLGAGFTTRSLKLFSTTARRDTCVATTRNKLVNRKILEIKAM